VVTSSYIGVIIILKRYKTFNPQFPRAVRRATALLSGTAFMAARLNQALAEKRHVMTLSIEVTPKGEPGDEKCLGVYLFRPWTGM
jgi:hypothetical protein